MNWQYDPPPSDRAADLARSDFWPRLWRPVLHVVWRLVARILFRFRITGRQHVPRRGPFVIVANHAGHVDAPALMAAVPLRRVNTTHALAAKDYFWGRRWKGALVHTILNALPIDRTRGAEEALGDGRLLLQVGRGLILFPEGTRSTTGTMAPFKRGVGHLVAGSSVPVIPAAIFGSRDILPKGRTLPRRGRIRVRFGPPLTFAQTTDDKAGWQTIAAELESQVRGLLEEAA